MSTLERRIAELLVKKQESIVSAQVTAINLEERTILDSSTIPQFTEDLPIPAVYAPVVEDDNCGKTTHAYAVDVSEFQQQILPQGYPTTTVYGYGGVVKDTVTGLCAYKRSAPGPTFEAIRGQKVKVQFINRLVKPHMLAVDPTLHWANPNNMPDPPAPWPLFPPGYSQAQFPIPTVTHLHGGENPSIYDGHPDAWFTAGEERGSAFVTSEMIYENTQPATTLWYHDHTMGITRLNVVAGMAGFYLLRDPKDPWESLTNCCGFSLPRGEYEIPIVIQDRMFYTDGSIYYPEEGTAPSIHPYWVPGYIGDCFVVNGKVWPRLLVKPTWYRLRLLNGSNERVYNLSFENNMAFWMIGGDSGNLPHPVQLTSLLVAPGERYDLLIDFSLCSSGEQILLKNDARAPYPAGDPVDESTTAKVMRFDIIGESLQNVPYFQFPRLCPLPQLNVGIRARYIVLNAQTQEDDIVTMMTLNGMEWMMHPTETPLVGSTEDWYIIKMYLVEHTPFICI